MKKGQSLTEVGMVGSLIFGVSILSLVLFGDNLSSYFNKTSVSSIFNNSRTVKAESLVKYITGINIKIGDTNFSSPVELVIASKIQQNNYQQTSGSSGQVRETLEVISKYIDQISILLANPSSGLTASQINELTTSLNQYKDEISAYIALDNNKATTNNTKLAQALDLSVNFSLNGDTATNFYNSVNSILSTMGDSSGKNLLSEYSNSILNLGTSLDYKVDSRMMQELGIKNIDVAQKSNITEITEKAVEISGSLANYMKMSVNKINPQPNNTSLITEFTDFCTFVIQSIFGYEDATANKPVAQTISVLTSDEFKKLTPTLRDIDNKINEINKKINEFSSKTKPAELNKKTAELEKFIKDKVKDLRSYRNKVKELAPDDPIIQQLDSFIAQTQETASASTNQKLELISKLRDQTLTAEQAKSIEVYRNGTYHDIIPASYNNEALCKTIGGTIKDKDCITN